MNRVGAEGAGESVWLGWFTHATLQRYLPLAERRGDHARIRRWRLKQALGKTWRTRPDLLLARAGRLSAAEAREQAELLNEFLQESGEP
jgi:tRNA G37 N-methylase TrmD